jgi:hypothetical protein
MGKGRDKRRRLGYAAPHSVKAAPPEVEPPEDPEAFVLAPLKPKPSAGSGAIALPEPDEPESSFVEFVGNRHKAN